MDREMMEQAYFEQFSENEVDDEIEILHKAFSDLLAAHLRDIETGKVELYYVSLDFTKVVESRPTTDEEGYPILWIAGKPIRIDYRDH